MSFLKTTWRRYLAWLVLVCLFAAACVLLSRWQFDRRAQVLAVINTIDSNYDQPPKPLSALLSDTNTALPADKQWLPAEVHGSYVPSMTTLVRNKPYGGNPGFEVLVPFRTDQNTVVVVDRGWLPTGNAQDSPDHVPAVTDEPMTLVGRLMPGEAALNRTAPEGQIPSIYLPAFATFDSAKTYLNAYLMLDRESVKQPQATKIARPNYGEGNHLSYAIQWIVFGVLAFATLFWAVRKELEFYRAANVPGYVAKPKRKTKTDADAEVEDALLD